MKRSGKFYRRNEEEVMKSLGLEPTPNSGSGWIVKEDGQNENIICQLKSTDANSIRISKTDLDTLNYNAMVSHKIPLFVIQFLQTNEIYLLIKPDDLELIPGLINHKKIDISSFDIFNIPHGHPGDYEDMKNKSIKKIKSSKSSREEFMLENDGKYKKKSKSAK